MDKVYMRAKQMMGRGRVYGRVGCVGGGHGQQQQPGRGKLVRCIDVKGCTVGLKCGLFGLRWLP